jgi:hypothetical protein
MELLAGLVQRARQERAPRWVTGRLPSDRKTAMVQASIVAAVAAAHNGSLELQARPEGGPRVQITLPGPAVQQLAGATR